MPADRVVVVGAGIGGLAAALDLAVKGVRVTVVERAATPGGKLRQVAVGEARIDAGPTVFTLRRVFEELFADAGADLASHVTLRPAATLARHAWGPDERLDLFADIDRSADAIGAFAGAAEATGYRAFCARAQRMYQTLDHAFMRAPRPSSPLGLIGRAPTADLLRISPFATLWGALGEFFRDPRLRQLFGRYSTYCGASPYLAPATLMLIAHAERDGVWLVDGGMIRLATALAGLAAAHGVEFRYGASVDQVVVADGRATGVRLGSGEHIDADAVVVNADTAAVTTGLFGRDAARAVPDTGASRSLSAVTWAMAAPTEGFPLLRHNVFFSDDYAAEFDAIFRHARLPGAPTIYVCAQDRDDAGAGPDGPERLLCLVNAPPAGDRRPFDTTEIDPCATRTFQHLERCGLRILRRPETTAVTTPADFHRLFPATGGALYGPAMHSAMAPFRRPGSRSRIPNLYLAGGSTHPGAGVPMAALSGRQAAASLLADLAAVRPASTNPSRRAATRGGTSMR